MVHPVFHDRTLTASIEKGTKIHAYAIILGDNSPRKETKGPGALTLQSHHIIISALLLVVVLLLLLLLLLWWWWLFFVALNILRLR